MNIKDPEVREMALRLAARQGTTATGAVRRALVEALEREDAQRAGMADRLMEIGRRSAARSEAFLTDADLYDEEGMPR